MAILFRRFVGALALDPGTFEDIEADRGAGMQSIVVVLAVSLAGGIGSIGTGAIGMAGFLTGTVMILGAWLLWVAVIATIGSVTLAEPQTSSNVRELLRVLGYAAAPGVFLVFAAVRSAAPIVVLIVAVWMIAAAVIAVRQALDYRHTGRAVAVCAIAWLVSFGTLAAVAVFFSQPVA
jgi:fucose 4-O-acetylase-like acetyltransferase